MQKLLSLTVLSVLLGGGFLLLKNFDIEGLDKIALRPKSGDVSPTGLQGAPPVERNGNTIRIASFNIQVFGESKIAKPEVMSVLTDVVRRFDVVAIQEIRAKSQDIIPRFVKMLNADGRHYDFVIGTRQGRTSSKEQYAFIFDAASIEVDRTATYDVADPHDYLHRPPLVAAFRVRGPAPEEAFTFTLINMHTDPDETDTELDVLDDVFREVRNDTRGEDDIILLGDLNVDDRNLGELGQVSEIMWVISGVPTNTRGTKLYDNILFHRRATEEFTGRAGVFDLMGEYGLTLDQALSVSDHLPVWAEFSVYEGGRPSRIAGRDTESSGVE